MRRTLYKDPRDRATGMRVCAHPDCVEPGLHPAPKTRDRLRDYFWFCKVHAREYNAAWDFCRGLGQAQIDSMIRHDTVWGRPTWPLGMQQAARRISHFMTIPACSTMDRERGIGLIPPVAPILPAGHRALEQRFGPCGH